MWPKDWKPESAKGDFHAYLLEKMKNLARKHKVKKEKQKLQQEFADLEAFVIDK